jgi:protein-tyrosine phosphatase
VDAVVDLHSHVLPGLDDGARSLAEGVAMARAAHADGIEALVATPHVRYDFPTTPEEMEGRLAELREALAAASVPLDVLPGGELDRAAAVELDDASLGRFGLGGNPRLLLLESPYSTWGADVGAAARHLASRGFRVLLAHPERNGAVQAHPEVLAPLVADGVLVQLTAASVDGRLGGRCREASRVLLERELVHVISSDAHGPDARGWGLSAAAAAVGDEELAHWLTASVPAALVAGEPLPPRPPWVGSRGGRRRRFLGG